jgi:putative membrane protein
MDYGIGLFLQFLGVCMVLWLLGLGIYGLITPVRELKLIADGNRAAAVSLSGAAIAVAAAIAGAAAVSTSIPDLVKMGAVSVGCLLLAFIVIALLLPSFRRGINDDKLSYGILLGGMSLAVSLLCVGAMLSLTE